METLSSGEKKGVLRLIFFKNTKSIHNYTKIWPLVE
jgi:hypothetical protein